MDDLDILKKDWNTTQSGQKALSANEIAPMLMKKSSSIVKTLFYISIAELVFWILINALPYFMSDGYKARMNEIYGDGIFFTIITVFSYAVIILFVYLLYKSHKAISVTDNARKLMESILKTRKVIKYYVIYNLVMAFVSILISLFFALNHNEQLSNQLAHFNNKQMFLFTAFMIGIVGVFIFVIWLFYRIIYGILLRRLNKNYNELKKYEV